MIYKMHKNIYGNNGNNSFEAGKSIYNIDESGIQTVNTGQSLGDLLGQLQPVSGPTSTNSGDQNFSNATANSLAANNASILQNFYVGPGDLLQILTGNPVIINGQFVQTVFITTKEFQATTIGHTNIFINVPYLYTTPDYVPTSAQAQDNYFMVDDSKFKVSGPITSIQSLKVTFTDPILTVSYIDRNDATVVDSHALDATTYDRGLAWEYTETDGGDINFGFMGYSHSLERIVFYKKGIYNGTSQYEIFQNGIDTGLIGTLLEYNVTRPSSSYYTAVDIDQLYTNTIISADHTDTRKLNIHAHDDMIISVALDGSENNPPSRNYDLTITVTGDIQETSKSFTGTYVNSYSVTTGSVDGIVFTSGTGGHTYTSTGPVEISSGSIYGVTETSGTQGYTNSSTGDILISTIAGKTITLSTGNINITNGSTNYINLTSGSGGFTEITTGAVSLTSGTTFDITSTGIFTLTGSDNINITNGTTKYINLTSGSGGFTEITTGAVSLTSGTTFDITSTGIFTLTGSDNINITNGTTKYINLTSGSGGFTNTSTGQISIQSNSSILLGTINNTIPITLGSNSIVTINNELVCPTISNADTLPSFHVTSSGEVTATSLYLQNNATGPIIEISGTDNQATRTYIITNMGNTGNVNLYIDGVSQNISISNGNIYKINGTINAIQTDGKIYNAIIESTISYIGNIVIVNNCFVNEILNSGQNFDFNVTNSGSNILFQGTSENGFVCNWYGEVNINITPIP
jgi:hypothetical protein